MWTVSPHVIVEPGTNFGPREGCDNATGAFTDRLRLKPGQRHAMIVPSQGIHLSSIQLFLQGESASWFRNRDGRVLFAIPCTVTHW